MAKKQQLGYKQIEANLTLWKTATPEAAEVGYAILTAFGKSEREIKRFKEGKGILKTFDGLLIKGEFCYRPSETATLNSTLEALKQDERVLKAKPKIICTSDGETVLAYDLRKHETYENLLQRMYCDFAFFYPLMGVERVHYVEESPADVKADMSLEQAIMLFKGPMQDYVKNHNGQLPTMEAADPKVRELAAAYLMIKNLKIRRDMGLEYEDEKGDKQ